MGIMSIIVDVNVIVIMGAMNIINMNIFFNMGAMSIIFNMNIIGAKWVL